MKSAEKPRTWGCTTFDPPLPTAAFCDANVLYPALLRDLLLRLAIAGLCELRWSEQVQDEWIRNLVEVYPDRAVALARTRALMEKALPAARTEGYESLMPSLALPDADDRHVLAAAIHSGAQVLLTFNLKDFPAERIPAGRVVVSHPDVWLASVMAQDEHLTFTVLNSMAAALRKPPLNYAQLAAALEKLNLPATASTVRKLMKP